jgi:hypothetical protein
VRGSSVGAESHHPVSFFANRSIRGYCCSGWISALDVSLSLKSVNDSLVLLNNGRQSSPVGSQWLGTSAAGLDCPSLIVHFLLPFCLDTFRTAFIYMPTSSAFVIGLMNIPKSSIKFIFYIFCNTANCRPPVLNVKISPHLTISVLGI